MTLTRMTHHINAPRAAVYRALLDPSAIEKWKVPYGMSCRVHYFDARVGGEFRISLTYDRPTGTGKTTTQTDTYRGRFERLVEGEELVEVDEFESDDPALRGEMRITITLVDANGGTDLRAVDRSAWLGSAVRRRKRDHHGCVGPADQGLATLPAAAATELLA